jgi:hypothetical protein
MASSFASFAPLRETVLRAPMKSVHAKAQSSQRNEMASFNSAETK